MDILFWLRLLLAFCEVIVAAKLSETFEKFYTTDVSYKPMTAQLQHSAVGVSIVAKFSILSHTPTLFKVRRPGLNNDVNTVSWESLQKPGRYLRYKNYKFHMEKNDGTELFKKDATFRERLGPRGRAYELLGRDNWFMCHTDTTPYTLKARSERIGTKDFVNNCVYVPVKQDMVEKKNIVKTLPSGGAMVINHVPSTQDTDKCISIRFVNNLGGPVRVVSSLKPEGYLVTANAFKLKTIFKHANHKQRHVIFYAENVQDRDDDVMLNDKNVFTIKPHECVDDFMNVILKSQSYEQAAKPDLGITTTNSDQIKPTLNNTPNTNVSSPTTDKGTPALPPSYHDTLQLPEASETPPKSQASTPKPAGAIVAKTTPSLILNDAKPTTQSVGILNSKKLQTNNPLTKPETMSLPRYYATPNPYPNRNPTFVAKEVGVAAMPLSTIHQIPAWNTANTNQLLQASYTAPLQNQIQNLDNVLQKRIQTQPVRPVLGSVPTSSARLSSDGYEPWSSYAPCSVSCGVGIRRRTRVCRPGNYCFGPAAETRACIKEQCASNCIHTTGGTVRGGSCCHFPFSFNGARYYHCILSPKNNERMWCSTTPYFEQDKQWGYCPRSAKAPERSFIKPVITIMPPQQNPQIKTQLSPYNTVEYKSDPDMTQDTSNVPCNTMCTRICDATCPQHCCLSLRADVPFTAYIGDNYDRNDKRSTVFPYQRRYRRSLSNDKRNSS